MQTADKACTSVNLLARFPTCQMETAFFISNDYVSAGPGETRSAPSNCLVPRNPWFQLPLRTGGVAGYGPPSASLQEKALSWRWNKWSGRLEANMTRTRSYSFRGC